MRIFTRALESVSSLLCASLIIWGMMNWAPGDPALRVLQARGILEPSSQQVAAVRAQLHLDEPVYIRYFDWLSGIIKGDFGISWRTGSSVGDELLSRLPATALLAFAALVMAVLLASCGGIPAALFKGRFPDHLARGWVLLTLSLPSFLIGVLVVDVFTVTMGWGRVIADGTWASVALPAFTLALGPAATWSRLLRTSLLDALGSSFLIVAKGRGASSWFLLSRHALPHCVPPLLTMIGLSAAALLGGAPIGEAVFSWPGVGSYTVQAIEARDLPVVAAATMVGVMAYLVISFLTDAALFLLDPRLEVRR